MRARTVLSTPNTLVGPRDTSPGAARETGTVCAAGGTFSADLVKSRTFRSLFCSSKSALHLVVTVEATITAAAVMALGSVGLKVSNIWGC